MRTRIRHSERKSHSLHQLIPYVTNVTLGDYGKSNSGFAVFAAIAAGLTLATKKKPSKSECYVIKFTFSRREA